MACKCHTYIYVYITAVAIAAAPPETLANCCICLFACNILPCSGAEWLAVQANHGTRATRAQNRMCPDHAYGMPCASNHRMPQEQPPPPELPDHAVDPGTRLHRPLLQQLHTCRRQTMEDCDDCDDIKLYCLTQRPFRAATVDLIPARMYALPLHIATLNNGRNKLEPLHRDI